MSSSTVNPAEDKQNGSKLSVEESREKRLARVKSKQRDRGGIFKPAESNPLIDILLARDVTGRSPPKARRKSGGSSLKKGREGKAGSAPEPRKNDNRHKSTTPAAERIGRGKPRKGSRAASREVEDGLSRRNATDTDKEKADKCKQRTVYRRRVINVLTCSIKLFHGAKPAQRDRSHLRMTLEAPLVRLMSLLHYIH